MKIKHAYDLKIGQSYILSDGFDHDVVKLVRQNTYDDQSYYLDGVKMAVP